MKLTYIGHACFRMQSQEGTVAITDPYDASVGIEQVPLRADLITMSHEHHDHNCMDCVEGQPVILRGTQAGKVGGIRTVAFSSYHDDAQGEKRGMNAIRLFEVDGLRILHMGDQGCMPEEEILRQICGADVMMIPVGGFYTVDAQQAAEIVRKTEPRCVIPMHVKTRRCTYPISPVWPFAALMDKEKARPQRELTLLPGQVPEGLVLLKPQTDEL